jgi:signal transduction histidine kinase
MTRRRAYWLCQIGGWTLHSAVLAVLHWMQVGYSAKPLLNFAVSIGLGIGLTHAFRAYVRYAGWMDLSLWRLAPRVVGASGVLAALFVGLGDLLAIAGVLHIAGMSPEQYWTVTRAVMSIVGLSSLFFLWSLLYFGLHYFWNYRQAEVNAWKLEAQAEAARLKALKLQLNPHFFFNSLNSVRALIAEDPERAQSMVTRLARLLRTTLQASDTKTVPLREEIDTVRTYLALEQVRLEERLRYTIDVPEAAAERCVPFLLVQTLVENGIKHGVARWPEGGTIRIEATVEADDRLCIRVANTGRLEAEDTGGIGLENARERLRLLFGDDAALTLDNGDADTVVATVRLPNERPVPTGATAPDREARPGRAPSPARAGV